MANFTEMGNGMPNIFNFIPEAGKSGSGINDLAGLLALSKDGNNNDGWGGQWAVWLIFILAFCNGGFGGFGRNGFGAGFGTPEVQSALSNEYLLTAINSASRDNVNFVQNLANQLNCDTNAIQNAINQGFQSIKDMMCDYKIEALQTRNAELNNSVQTLQQYNALQALINPITAKLDYLECIIPPRPIPAYQAYPYGYNNGYGCNNGCGCPASTTVTPA